MSMEMVEDVSQTGQICKELLDVGMSMGVVKSQTSIIKGIVQKTLTSFWTPATSRSRTPWLR
jgi:hypothetical protein